MDTERIRSDVMAFLHLTSPVDRARVDMAIGLIVDNILTFSDWSFLDTDTPISVTSSRSKYDTARDFLYPLPGSIYCEADSLLIEIVSPEWLHTTYPDLSSIDGLRYCIFFGRQMEFYRVDGLTGTKTVKYGYHKRGSISDLDFDPGFVDIVRNGVIKNVAKAGSAEQLQGQIAYFKGLAVKANLYKRQFGGDSKFVPSQKTKAFQTIRKDLRWK